MNYLVDAREVLIDHLYRIQKGICPECKEPLSGRYGLRYVRDPYHDGGTHTLDNAQLIHAQCSSHGASERRAQKARELGAKGMKPPEIAKTMDISLRTAFRYLRGK